MCISYIKCMYVIGIAYLVGIKKVSDVIQNEENRKL